MDTNQLPHPTLEPLLDVTELADYLGVPLSTVYDWRSRGLGPRAYRFGKRVKFALSDVQSWMEAQRSAAAQGWLVEWRHRTGLSGMHGGVAK